MAQFESIAVIGLGLIGGSVAGAVKHRGLVSHVSGYALHSHSDEARERGLIDSSCATIKETVQQAELVVVATPVVALDDVFEEVSRHVLPHAIITDCTSTKRTAIAAARKHLGDGFSRFVPGHPISGSEFSGPSAANVDQYVDKLWLLTPMPETDPTACERVRSLVTGFGARCEDMDAARHDELFAEYSHAPHALVYAICDAVANGPNAAQLADLAGAGFKDTTRIGATAPELWTDILLDNHEHVLEAMDRYLESMQVMRDALASQDREGLLRLLERASTWRRGLE
jgi:prephenate dehydrogenase